MKEYQIVYSNQFWIDLQEVLDGIMEVSSSPRSVNVGKYKIVYQVVESIKEVRIARLVLRRRNLVGLFA